MTLREFVAKLSPYLVTHGDAEVVVEVPDCDSENVYVEMPALYVIPNDDGAVVIEIVE